MSAANKITPGERTWRTNRRNFLSFLGGFSKDPRLRPLVRLAEEASLMRTKICAGIAVLAFAVAALWLHAPAPVRADAQSIGLSLFFQNSQMTPITLVGDHPRYLSEVDITATTPSSPVDNGIQPLISSSEFSALDWTGVHMVEEDWRPPGDGTFTRQRFYRGANWMEQPSQFQVFPLDSQGAQAGPPLFALAGTDDAWLPSDDGFVRRFVVRQIATGCPAVNNCNGAQFSVQGLVQWRHNLNSDIRTRSIPAQTAQLSLIWSQDPAHPRTVPVGHAADSSFSFGYGFSIGLAALNPPANGSYYVRGENVTVQVTYMDGQGNRLFPPGVLPTYFQFITGQIPAGLRYYDGFRLFPTLYYALKHRESNLLVSLSGPTSLLRTPQTTVDISQFFAPGQVTAATVANDGFSAAAQGIPPLGILFGGLFNPSLWNLPVSDQVTFTIPADALPGTYVIATKARREFGGEAQNRGSTLDIPVGTATPTTFTFKTGNCDQCHTGASAIGSVLHGISDRRACFSCHPGLSFEPDTPLDIRVHTVHDRSDRFPADIHQCSVCHLTTPTGPARGLLP